MKLLHLADLHIGKKLFDVSLREDQEYILEQILKIIEEEEPDALLIAGDVYDKAQASAEAVQIFDQFLTRLRDFSCEILIIAGNHDAPARLAYARNLLRSLRIHLAGELDAWPSYVTLEDSFGPVHFVLLPFFRLYEVRALWPDEAFASYDEALAKLLATLDLPSGERKVFVAHQHFSNSLAPSERSDSELDIVGGLDAINSEVLQDFSYVALGHLHRPQKVGVPHIRYAGSPLAYSFSEINQKKSVPIITLGEPGQPAEIRLRELEPLRQVRELRGTMEQLLLEAKALPEARRQDFLRITLTDEERVENPMRRLQAWYVNLLTLRIERQEAALAGGMSGLATQPEVAKQPVDLFSDFYQEQRGFPLAAEEKAALEAMWQALVEAEEVEARR